MFASALAIWGEGGLNELGRGEGGFTSALAIWGDRGLKAQFHVLHAPGPRAVGSCVCLRPWRVICTSPPASREQ